VGPLFGLHAGVDIRLKKQILLIHRLIGPRMASAPY
jgi:hypothetical protein